MAAYLEHMAFKVNDLDWCVRFFQEVFDMPIRLSLGQAPHRKIWLHAGIQLNEDLEYKNEEGRCDHFALMVSDYDEVLKKCLGFGCKALPTGENWIQMPNGMIIELKRGDQKALDTIISQKPWVD
ncbi:VOC family protein [Holdemanella porci]|uniref:VOC family protein n=1 Tax=Holdemanella porci TaxID=2652276 RepID=UPI003AB4F482